jgi:hypothetical protein
LLFVKFSELQVINSKNLKKLREAEHDKDELIGELSDSLDLCKTLKSENHVLANKVGSLENELKESKTLLEKFSNDSLDKFLHTQKSTCDKPVIDFDKIIAPSFNHASSSKKVFVETENLEEPLDKGKLVVVHSSRRRGKEIFKEKKKIATATS